MKNFIVDSLVRGLCALSLLAVGIALVGEQRTEAARFLLACPAPAGVCPGAAGLGFACTIPGVACHLSWYNGFPDCLCTT